MDQLPLSLDHNCDRNKRAFPLTSKGASPNYFFYYNVIVMFRGRRVEHVTFWFGTIGLGMSLGLFGLENEADSVKQNI